MEVESKATICVSELLEIWYGGGYNDEWKHSPGTLESSSQHAVNMLKRWWATRQMMAVSAHAKSEPRLADLEFFIKMETKPHIVSQS